MLLLLIPAIRPLWTFAAPAAAVQTAWREGFGESGYWQRPYEVDGEVRDPWGRAFVEYSLAGQLSAYSRGPNGRDEAGAGDDVLVEGGPRPLFAWARELLLASALLLGAWSLWRFLLLAPRSRYASAEIVRSAVIAFGAWGLLVILGALVCFHSSWWRYLLRTLARALDWLPLALSPWVSLMGTLFTSLFLGVLWFRLSSAPESREPAEAPTRSPLGWPDSLVMIAIGVILGIAPFAQGIQRELDPDLRVYQRRRDGEPLDPWGTPWCSTSTLDSHSWSAGPNRVDEAGRGDDVYVGGGNLISFDHAFYEASGRLVAWLAIILLAAWALARFWVLPRLRGLQALARGGAAGDPDPV